MKISQVNNSVLSYSTDAQQKSIETKKNDKKNYGVQPVSVQTNTVGEAKLKTSIEDVLKNENVDENVLKKSIDQANKSLEVHNRLIERSIHDVTHTVMYVVKDTVTNEVIAEFPPKKIQDMIAKMWELAGLVVDEKA